jgi:hypothetical protein
MAVVDDWAAKAVELIAIEPDRHKPGQDTDFGLVRSEHWKQRIVRIITEHYPLKPDVAYMPVPRCSTCRHWHGAAEGSNETSDGRRTCVEPTIGTDQMDEFMTRPDFGCVQWEEK